MTNEFRVGFNRFNENIPAGNFSYAGVDAFPNITLKDLRSGLNIGPDSNAPQFTIQNFYQIVDNVSIVKGKHTLKVGGEYRWYISPQGFTQRSRGDYVYNGTQVFLEDFSPDNSGQRSTGSSTYYGNEKAIYFFANDSWRVTQHLTSMPEFAMSTHDTDWREPADAKRARMCPLPQTQLRQFSPCRPQLTNPKVLVNTFVQ